MAVATFTIGEQHFSLKLGIYLIRGISGGVPNEVSEFTTELQLNCQHASIEDKHAIIFVENVGISVLDLQTRTGTYLAEKDGVYKRLAPLQKTAVAHFQNLRIGDLSGALILCSLIDQQHSSGFHDLLDTSHVSSENGSDKTDSFNIPETQVENVSLLEKAENEKNKTSENNASIPETQDAHLAVSSNQECSQFVMSTQEFNASCERALDHYSDDLLKDFDWLADSSQATTVAAKQPSEKYDENALKTAADCSSVEMDALNWSNTTVSKSENTAMGQQADRSVSTSPHLFEPYKPSIKSLRNQSKQQIISADSATEPVNNAGLSTIGNLESKNNTLHDSRKVLPSSTCSSNNDEESTTSQIIKSLDTAETTKTCYNIDQPLELSNKENMKSCEAILSDLNPTQPFISNNAIVVLCNQIIKSPKLPELLDVDLLPTQVFKAKKDKIFQSEATVKPSTSSNIDLEPTQIFIAKNAVQHESTSTPLRVAEQVEKTDQKTVPQISKSSVVDFFETAEKSLCEETTVKKSTTNCEELLFDTISVPDSEFLMQTPRMIADVFNRNTHSLTPAQGRNLLNTLSEESNSQKTLTKTNATPKDFDCLIESIRKNSNTLTDTEKEITTDVTVKDFADNVMKTEKKEKKLDTGNKHKNSISQNSKSDKNAKPYLPESVNDKDIEFVPTVNEKLDPENRKRKTERSSKNRHKETNATSQITKNKNTSDMRPSRTTKRQFSEAKANNSVPSHSVSKKIQKELTSSDSTARSANLKKIEQREAKDTTQIDTNTKAVSKLASRTLRVRKTSETESLATSKTCRRDSNSSTSTTTSGRTTRSRAQNESSRVKRSESISSENAPAISQTESTLKNKNHIKTVDRKQKTNKSTLPEPNKMEKTRKRKIETMQEQNEQPTTSKTKKTENPLQIAFTMVQPDKQKELLKKANNFWSIAKTLSESKVLVMDVGSRTVKFLIAMAKGTPIVTTKWVEAFNASGLQSMSTKLIFKDEQFEKEFKFSILRTLRKALTKRIFENLHFVLTEKILPQPCDMKEIIECAGGTVHNEPPMISSSWFLISSKEDSRVWHSYRRKHENICITSTEAVMLAIMRYEVTLLQKLSF